MEVYAGPLSLLWEFLKTNQWSADHNAMVMDFQISIQMLWFLAFFKKKETLPGVHPNEAKDW